MINDTKSLPRNISSNKKTMIRKVITLITLVSYSIGFAQLYDNNGVYDIEIAKNNSFNYMSNEYEVKSLAYSESTEGNVYIEITPEKIEMFENESFQFILNVTSIVPKKTGAGNFYTLYVGTDSEGNPASFTVKWNIFSEQYYFEYEAGTNPRDSYRYTFYKTKVNN